MTSDLRWRSPLTRGSPVHMHRPAEEFSPEEKGSST
jgi:hypothetical protein